MEFPGGTNWRAFSRYAGNVVGAHAGDGGALRVLPRVDFSVAPGLRGERLSRVGHFRRRSPSFWELLRPTSSSRPTRSCSIRRATRSEPTARCGSRASVSSSSAPGRWSVSPTTLPHVVTASVVVASLGAFYLLQGRHLEPARLFLRLGLAFGLVSSVLVAFPTGDAQAKLVARHQPSRWPPLEGRFESGPDAPLHLIGQPNGGAAARTIPSRFPASCPSWRSGISEAPFRLDAFPEADWPDNVPLLYSPSTSWPPRTS